MTDRARAATRRRGVAWALAALLVSSAGCGGGLRTYPVEGRVTFPDGSPLTGGIVEFETDTPAGKRINASAEIRADGHYDLQSNIDGRMVNGAVEGTHRVVVVPMPPGIGNMSGAAPPAPIDRRFRDYHRSGLTYTVKPGRNEYPITVEKPPSEATPAGQ